MSLIIIDGNSLMHRAYYALPPMNNKDGEPTNAIFGFFSMLFKLIDDYSPEYLAVAFDRHEKTFRHVKYDGYKAGRRATPDDLRPQFPLLRESLDKMGICTLDCLNFEADDILGTVSRIASEKNIKSYLVTGDRDALQLADENTTIIFTKKGVKEVELYSAEHINEVYGLTPKEMIELKSLMGDSSDNIPGIAGIGEKTALKLLHEYRTLDNLYDNLDSLPKNKLYEKLANGKESAYFSKFLATIVRDAPIEKSLEDMAFNGFDEENTYKALERLSFNAFIKKLGLKASEEDEQHKKIKLTEIKDTNELFALKNRILSEKKLALIDAEDSMYIAYNSEEDFVLKFSMDLLSNGISREDFAKAFKEVFESEEVKKVIHSSKDFRHYLYDNCVALKSVEFDTAIASYVLDSNIKNYDTEKLYRSTSAGMLFDIKATQENEIKEKGLSKIFYEIEMPLLDVLFDMEINGFKVDIDALHSLERKYNAYIKEVSEEIYSLAGMKFNIASPKQLGELLFENRKLPHGRKTKSGYSTDIEVLEDIAELDPIVPKVIEFRQASKLKNTYVDGLISAADSKDSKVRTTFKQTAAATGRISSNEPNLQNIPIRQQGEIRAVFLPSDDEHILISADYSQIELRVLASIAKDERMYDAFISGEDIHARTASEVFGVSKEEVTSNMRSAAKAVNFGIVYGISDFGLAKNIGTSRKEAAKYIEKYLEEFSGVASYMNDIVENAKKQGFVSTLFGRIRYIKELSSSNYNLRQFGERAAMNTPIQGTAADIIKLAMIRVYEKLQSSGLKSKLIMQVHDELIIDALKSESEKVKQILSDAMENAVKLAVPLNINIAEGNNWEEAK